jgi:excisionase family DNA binding protein
MSEANKPFTVAEAADYLTLGQSTVYELCAAGKIAHSRIGLKRGTIRIQKKALEDYLNESRVTTDKRDFRVTLTDLRAAA